MNSSTPTTYWYAFLVLFFAGLLSQKAIAQNCSNDTIPPIANCSGNLQASLDPTGNFILNPLWVIGNSTDNCGIADVRIAIQDSIGSLSSPPAATAFNFNCCYTGLNKLTTWVIDSSGNWDTCHINVILEDPFSVCDTSSIACSSQTISGKVFIDTNINCTNNQEVGLAGVSLQLQRIPDGAIYLTTTSDSLGNYSFTLPYHDGSDYTISILDENLQSSHYPCGTQSVVSIIGNSSQTVFDVPILFHQISGILYWDENENCLYEGESGIGLPDVLVISDSGQQYRKDLNDDGSYQFLLPFDTSANYSVEIIYDPFHIGVDILPGSFHCGNATSIQLSSTNWQATHNFPLLLHKITGYVYYDENENCVFDSTETGIPGVSIKASQTYPNGGTSVTFSTDSTGFYSVNRLSGDSSPWLLEILDLPSTALSCGSTANVYFIGDSLITTHDFGTQLVEDCPFLITDISTPTLERCFSTTYYSFNCNYGDTLAENVFVEIQFDTFLQVNSSTLPWVAVDSNKYTFVLDTLLPGECLNFEIDVTASCSAQLGQTHCVEATIFPQADCPPPPPSWSGAIIRTNAICEGDSIRLSIINEGMGDMDESLQFTVVEDLVMFSSGTFELNSGESYFQKVPANGATWRLEAMQEPGYPYASDPSSWIEGCGGINNLGIVTQFPTNTTAPYQSVDCRQNIGSFDPNDKQSTPRGVGPQHYIYPNQAIDYLIRFQNTGTAPARKVVVVDTISPLLNEASIKVGASSHEFEYQFLGNGVIQFVFDDINLPDSTSDVAASQGFIKFQIEQQADLPNGTIIENSAAIYFDFNDPIITNISWLTVDDSFLEEVVSATNIISPEASINFFPNPVQEQATIRVEGLKLQNGRLLVYDQLGRPIQQLYFSANELILQRNMLPPGIYIYQVLDHQKFIGSGKFIIH